MVQRRHGYGESVKVPFGRLKMMNSENICFSLANTEKMRQPLIEYICKCGLNFLSLIFMENVVGVKF